MEFRLLYSGRLLGASRNDSRASLKHEIRREFHPQLRRLWKSNFALQELMRRTGYSYQSKHHPDAMYYTNRGAEVSPDYVDYEQGQSLHTELGEDLMADKWERNGFRFIPLVTEEYCVRCALNILFLRPEEPGMIIKSGDIDARLKTLFDALRMPKNLDETGGMTPSEDENPFYCLLEDDKLISQVSVTTDNLLLLPKERDTQPNDALLVIHVTVLPSNIRQSDPAFY